LTWIFVVLSYYYVLAFPVLCDTTHMLFNILITLCGDAPMLCGAVWRLRCDVVRGTYAE
jgi:hypothetical protein